MTDQDLFETNWFGNNRIVRRIAFLIRKFHEVECKLCATAFYVRFCSLVKGVATHSGSVSCVNLTVVSVIRASETPWLFTTGGSGASSSSVPGTWSSEPVTARHSSNNTLYNSKVSTCQITVFYMYL